MRRRFVLAIAVVGALAFTGCGGGDDETAEPALRREGRTHVTTGAAGLPAACDLLTRVDVEAAFGEAVVAGTQGTDECWWSTANDLKTVNLIRRTDDLATWRSGYQNDFWVPNDLGDEGYTGKAFTSVVWREGDVQYEVNVVYSTRGEPERVVRELAGAAAARL